MKIKTVSSWGQLDHFEHQDIHLLHDRINVAEQLQQKNNSPGLAYGMGRSYGDVCLNPQGQLWQTRGLDRFISFDETTGLLVCEAGVLLREIQEIAIPRGWSLPVTPGTQLVTVGGAIANDVHGKNHHRFGSFGDHIQMLRLIRTDGKIIECGPKQNPDWFAATMGGLGLTGIIVEAAIQLRRVSSAWIDAEIIPYEGLDTFFQLANESSVNWEHTVAWFDCLSLKNHRGIFMRGNHSSASPYTSPRNKKRSVPFTPPISLINRWSLKPFNKTYYWLQARKAGHQLIHHQAFFYPLDNLLAWNRIYGPKGFFQYQCVVPHAVGKDAIQAMLQAIAQAKEGSVLAVLKTFGDRKSLGMLSFPKPGVTLALDFPNRGEKTLVLFSRLDEIIREAKGRIYPAKDARMPRDLFETGYPRLTEFLAYRDPNISSALSRRLIGS